MRASEFLAGYRGDGRAVAGSVRHGDGQALAVFELEKAVYELRYELNNRPDWVQDPGRRHRAHAATRTCRDPGASTQSAFGELDIWLARAGRHEELYAKLGAHRGRRRRALRGVGAERDVRQRRRRLQRLGLGCEHAEPGRRHRDLGRDRPRRRRRAALQVPPRRAREGRPDRLPGRGAAEDRVRRLRSRSTTGRTPTGSSRGDANRSRSTGR